jgi:hypothetical protein
MEIPQQFRDIAIQMHQDIDLVLPAETDRHSFVAYLVRGAAEPQRQVAAQFIDTLLSSGLSQQELVAIWAKAGADWYLSESDIKQFLEQLRDALRPAGP